MSLTMAGTITVQSSFSQYFVTDKYVYHYMCSFFAERLPASAIYVHDLSLQKEIGCFNHSVVILVADKLKKHW